MKRLWLLAGSLATVPALAFGTYAIVSFLAHETVTERATFEAAGVTAVELSSELGNVEITGADVEEISLTARIDHGLRRTRHSAEVDGNTLVVRDDCPTGIPVWCRVDYELEIPSSLRVQITAENGRVTVRDVDGGVQIRGGNGAVDVARVAGDVDLRTGNGRIEARGVDGGRVTARTGNGAIALSFVRPPDAVETRTGNGSIEVVVPQDETAYRLEVTTTFAGATDTAVRTDPTSERTIVARTSAGSITVRYPTG